MSSPWLSLTMVNIASPRRVYTPISRLAHRNHPVTIIKFMRSLLVVLACLLLVTLAGFARSPSDEVIESDEPIEDEAIETPAEVTAEQAPQSRQVTPTEARDTLMGSLGGSLTDDLVGCTNEWQRAELLNGFSHVMCDAFMGGEDAMSGVTIVLYQDLVVTISFDRVFGDLATANVLFGTLATQLSSDCEIQVEMANEQLYMCTSYGYFVDIFWVPGRINGIPASRFVLTFMLDPNLQALYNQSVTINGQVTDPI